MNWIPKYIKTKIKNRKDNIELKKSNWGRSFGWYVELNGEKIGELSYNEFEDMFWVSYKIIPYQGYEKQILDFQNWQACRFKFLNKHYPQYADGAFSGGSNIRKIENEYIISMRALYLVSIEQ